MPWTLHRRPDGAAYLESGDAAARRSIVFVHAFPMGAHMWEPQVVPSGWRAVAPALPGFDGTPPPGSSTSIDDYARAVIDLIDALSIERPVLAGLSMGGYVIFALWRLAPQRWPGIVLADTRAAADTEQGRAGREKMLELLRREGARGVADEMMPKLIGETTRRTRPAVADRVRALIEGQTPDGIAAAMVRLRDRPDSFSLLRGMSVPALVIVGEEDAITPVADSEALAGGLPDAELVRIPAAGHMANLEAPDAFNRTLGGFLNRFR